MPKIKELEEMLKKQKEGYEAVVHSIEKTNSNDYYATTDEEGNPVKSRYENRTGYKVTFIIKGEKDGAEWDEFFTHPTPQGFMSVKSRLGNFCRRYGTYPQEGMEVLAEIDDSGFFRVVL